MAMVSLFDAKNRLSVLVDAVEDGQEVTITRRSKRVARLVPVAPPVAQGHNAVDKVRALRQSIAQRGEVFTCDELKAFRDEGRR